MTKMLNKIDIVIECRDARVPFSSTNPLFERFFSNTTCPLKRIIIFTKSDLVSSNRNHEHNLLRDVLSPSKVHHTCNSSPGDIKRLLSTLRGISSDSAKLQRRTSANSTPFSSLRALVVGMPNVGKSSLLNALRMCGVGKGKAVRTGGQPGITRAVESAVKIIDGVRSHENDDDDGHVADPGTDIKSLASVYVVDTPGVFIPYVSNPETMLKLCLVGCVKDGIVSPVTLVDYLLYRLNLVDTGLYSTWSDPTNEVDVLLSRVANKIGKLIKGGGVDVDGTAMWIIQKYRAGKLGSSCLDTVTKEAWEQRQLDAQNEEPSMNQLKKQDKVARRDKQKRNAIVE